MANQLLDPELVNQLRLASQLSGTPVGGCFPTEEGDTVSLVATNEWVVTKDLFVTMWFWYMLNSKVYNSLVDRDAATVTIRSLNQEIVDSLKKPNWDLVDRVYNNINSTYLEQRLTTEAKRNILARILEECRISTGVEQEAA